MVTGDADRSEVILTMSRREYDELLTVLAKAEELCSELRLREHDFRMQRLRLQRKMVMSTVPPPLQATRETARYVETKDLADIVKPKK